MTYSTKEDIGDFLQKIALEGSSGKFESEKGSGYIFSGKMGYSQEDSCLSVQLPKGKPKQIQVDKVKYVRTNKNMMSITVHYQNGKNTTKLTLNHSQHL